VPVLWNGVTDEGPRSLIGLAACLIPVRRSLAVEPALAMKSDYASFRQGRAAETTSQDAPSATVARLLRYPAKIG
jgi:hypothetical protein